MGPIIGNMGNLQFVLTAIFGGVLSVAGVGGITLGVMASYLQFTRSFTQPFMQIAQQFNSIIMALAGAERIFHMIDEEPEVDDGYVTLVNARKPYRMSGAYRTLGVETSSSGRRKRDLYRTERRCEIL